MALFDNWISRHPWRCSVVPHGCSSRGGNPASRARRSMSDPPRGDQTEQPHPLFPANHDRLRNTYHRAVCLARDFAHPQRGRMSKPRANRRSSTRKGQRDRGRSRRSLSLWSCKHPINDGIPASVERIPEATKRSDRATSRPLDWQPVHRHTHSRSGPVRSLQSSASPQSSIV